MIVCNIIISILYVYAYSDRHASTSTTLHEKMTFMSFWTDLSPFSWINNHDHGQIYTATHTLTTNMKYCSCFYPHFIYHELFLIWNYCDRVPESFFFLCFYSAQSFFFRLLLLIWKFTYYGILVCCQKKCQKNMIEIPTTKKNHQIK